MADADRNQLKNYWTKDPRGLAKWATKPHPWTALYRELRKHVGSERAKRMASQWFKDVLPASGVAPVGRQEVRPVVAGRGAGQLAASQPMASRRPANPGPPMKCFFGIWPGERGGKNPVGPG